MSAQRLNKRLQMVAEMVRTGAVVADIGTDHAYVPAYLVANGIAKSAIASDLRSGPLHNAEETVRNCNLHDKIILRLSDGLDNINPDEADDIVLAGMGGILIVDLLERTSWIRDKSKRLILQPMSHAENVREFLCTHGFDIIGEEACTDNGKIYIAINCVYSGMATAYPAAYFYIGKLPECKNPCAVNYIQKINLRLRKRAKCLFESGKCLDEAKKLEKISSEISEVLEIL